MKKRILAGLLTFTMAVGQFMPVVAAGEDTEVVISAEETTEESSEEAAEAAEDAESDALVVDLATLSLEEREQLGELVESKVISDQNGEKVVENVYELNVVFEGGLPDAAEYADGLYVEDPETLQASSIPPYIGVGTPLTQNVATAATFSCDQGTFNLGTKVYYYTHINYRGKKVKPVDDLGATVTESGLYAMAEKLSGLSTVPHDLIKWKLTPKKNTKANGGAYFTIKASVNGKVAKSIGITKKTLTTYKKAVKEFNKAVKGFQFTFTIDPVNFDYMMSDWTRYTSWTMHFVDYYLGNVYQYTEVVGPRVKCWIRPDQDPYITRKWTKPSAKDVSIKKNTDKKFRVTANNLNYGSNGYYSMSVSKGKDGRYYADFEFTRTR
ncbi:MAG: hypothetical protein K6E50_05620 [Lachnospiraceae bacterium]|nr:hypothetical protein [Lachnospiraceae bacterium]